MIVVAQAIRLATGKQHFSELNKKLITAAGKFNKPKSRKYNVMWDLHDGFNYVFTMFDTPRTYKQHVEQFIVVFRLMSGWRSADLAGIFRSNSIERKEDGYFIRNFSSKTRKGKWSEYSFFPRISNKTYKTFCVPSRIDAILKASKNFDVVTVWAGDKWNTPLLTQAIPSDDGKYSQLSVSSIKQKVRDTFLDVWVPDTTSVKSLHGRGYGPHSLRHANASAMKPLGISYADAARHQQTSQQSLEGTYVTQVLSDWEIPLDCVSKHDSIVKKLLIPFVHYHSNECNTL